MSVIQKNSPMGTYVGELQERWQFPSDHLPIGMTCGDLRFASWNILDAQYTYFLHDNQEGLSRSLIAKEDVRLGDSALTVRDVHVARLVTEIAKTHHIIALQECSEPFLINLKTQLPKQFEVISSGEIAFAIDKTKCKVLATQSMVGVFSERPKRIFLQLTIESDQRSLCLINAHLPWDSLKATYELGNFILKSCPKATIAMGDMNFNEHLMRDALDKSYAVHSPYPTNIDPGRFVSKAIDHFIVPSDKPVVLDSPEQVIAGLSKMVNLLSP